MKTRLLSSTGIAVAALVLGVGIANAQTSAAPSSPAGPSSKAPATSSTSPGVQSGGVSSGANGPAPNAASGTNLPSNSDDRTRANSATPSPKDTTSTHNATAPSGGASGSTSSPTHAAAAPAVNLNTELKTEIRNTVIKSGNAPRVSSVNFNVAVGVAVPATVHFAPVPATIVRIEPAWRGYEYFVYSEEIIIVDPHTRRIIAILVV